MITQDFKIKDITPLAKESLKQGIFLCLFGTDKIPPHLGLIANGCYYSSSAKGSRVGENVDLILRRVNQSAIPTLFIELSIEVSQEKLVKSFKAYPKLKEGETCLLPIKDYINSIDINVSEAKFVYELFPLLNERALVKQAYSLHMNVGSFELPIYTKQDITNRIVKLQETC